MHTLETMFGIAASTDHLTVCQMSLRALVAYLCALVLVRAARRRFMGRNSALDAIVAITFGSTLSRGLTGNSPFWPVIAACAVLAVVDLLLALASCRWHGFGSLIKGKSVLLVRQGIVDRSKMLANVISDHDLEQNMRLHGGLVDFDQVALATLESSGKISIMRKPSPPRVLEVRVEQGVQTVRIELQAG